MCACTEPTASFFTNRFGVGHRIVESTEKSPINQTQAKWPAFARIWSAAAAIAGIAKREYKKKKKKNSETRNHKDAKLAIISSVTSAQKKTATEEGIVELGKNGFSQQQQHTTVNRIEHCGMFRVCCFFLILLIFFLYLSSLVATIIKLEVVKMLIRIWHHAPRTYTHSAHRRNANRIIC